MCRCELAVGVFMDFSKLLPGASKGVEGIAAWRLMWSLRRGDEVEVRAQLWREGLAGRAG